MSTSLYEVVIDAIDIGAQARFWSQMLDWTITESNDDDVTIAPASGPGIPILFERVTSSKISKNRQHLDLSSDDTTHQREWADRAIDLGATLFDNGQSADAPWIVLKDPEGNEFCVCLKEASGDTGAIGQIVLDAEDTHALATFWEQATGWTTIFQEPGYRAIRDPSNTGPVIAMGPPVAAKLEKNRIHMDVIPPPGGDQEAEVERLIALGARRIDIGQGEQSWVVMADPEDNEFCVLHPGAESR